MEFQGSTGRNCQLPPEGSYTVEGTEVIIDAGKSQSSQIKVSANSDKLQEEFLIVCQYPYFCRRR